MHGIAGSVKRWVYTDFVHDTDQLHALGQPLEPRRPALPVRPHHLVNVLRYVRQHGLGQPVCQIGVVVVAVNRPRLGYAGVQINVNLTARQSRGKHTRHGHYRRSA